MAPEWPEPGTRNREQRSGSPINTGWTKGGLNKDEFSLGEAKLKAAASEAELHESIH